MIAQPSVIDQAISKYGGSDEAYKQKLKEHIRGAMGYSNEMDRLNQETSAPADIGNIKGLSPAGINARISSRFGQQDQRVAGIQSNANAIDTVAGSLADAQAAREKSASSKADAAGLSFQPTNWVQTEAMDYIKNSMPGTDGKYESRDEMIKRLQGAALGEGNIPSEQVKAIVDNLVPKDFEDKRAYYQARYNGYSKAQAEDLQNFDRYANGQMSPAEKKIYDLTNPTWAAKADDMKASKDLIPDITATIKDEKTGEEIPQFTYPQLVEKYPNLTPAQIAEYTKPVYNKYLQDDIKKQLPVGMVQDAVKNNSFDISTWADFMNTDEYKNFKKAIIPMYGGLYTDQELDVLIHNQVMNEL